MATFHQCVPFPPKWRGSMLDRPSCYSLRGIGRSLERRMTSVLSPSSGIRPASDCGTSRGEAGRFRQLTSLWRQQRPRLLFSIGIGRSYVFGVVRVFRRGAVPQLVVRQKESDHTFPERQRERLLQFPLALVFDGGDSFHYADRFPVPDFVADLLHERISRTRRWRTTASR